MGRPTLEKKDHTVKLRISEEMWTALQKKGENISELIREYIKFGLNSGRRQLYKPRNEYWESKFLALKTCCDENVVKQFEKLDFNGLRIIGTAPQERISVDREFQSIAHVFGMTGAEFAVRVVNGIEDGEIVYEDGKFVGFQEYDFGPFLKACKKKKVDPQEMIEKAAEMINEI